MASIEELRRMLEEERHLREEEQRRREEAEGRVLEAEQLATSSQPLTLEAYITACHSLDLSVRVVTDPSSTTQGDTTDPIGRIFPRRIIPWDDFPARQEQIWNDLATGDLFSLPAFPSQHQLEYVKSLLRPISSELGLRDFERDVVENAIRKLFEQAYMDPSSRSSLGIEGTVTFESHTNLGADDISDTLGHMSLDGDGATASTSTSNPARLAAPKARRRAKGKGSRADQYCVYRTADDVNIPTVAIEYKAPHKLSVDEIVTGLEAEIWPERDVIHKDGNDFAFAAKKLAAAVVTQLFSYMVGKGIQYGYICTAEAFVFLHIPQDPSTVYYSVCVPKLDVMDDDEARLHRTAVAQVFAFILQAVRATPPSQTWFDEADKLDVWAVEYDDVLKSIPASIRKSKEARHSPYKPQRWKGFTRSPIQTRSSCQLPGSSPRRSADDDDDPPSPSPNPSGTSGKMTPSAGAGSRSGRGGQRQSKQGRANIPNVQSRPFCSQQCLRGLLGGRPMDEQCPNIDDHGKSHIRPAEFLHRIQDQLARDRGRDADCVPLHRSGARGTLFKVRLSSHGYTLVAKGMESLDSAHLKREEEVYSRLKAIQGKYIPVCLGRIDLILPWNYDGGVYMHFLFLGWAGRPLSGYAGQIDKSDAAKSITAIFKAFHRRGVLHSDAEPRNILYNTTSGTLMVVDLERAELRDRQPLNQIGDNDWNRKQMRGVSQKRRKDDFTLELESVVEKTSRCLSGTSNML